MTIKVRITHDQPGYNKNIKVSLINEVNNPLTNDVTRLGVHTKIVKPGQSVEEYVYTGQKILIEEQYLE